MAAEGGDINLVDAVNRWVGREGDGDGGNFEDASKQAVRIVALIARGQITLREGMHEAGEDTY